IYGKQLFVVNAHVNLETGDLIGAQRPVRNRSAIEKQLRSDLQTILGQDGTELTSLDELKNAFTAASTEQLTACDQEVVRRVEQNIVRSNALFEWSDGSLISAMK